MKHPPLIESVAAVLSNEPQNRHQIHTRLHRAGHLASESMVSNALAELKKQGLAKNPALNEWTIGITRKGKP